MAVTGHDQGREVQGPQESLALAMAAVAVDASLTFLTRRA